MATRSGRSRRNILSAAETEEVVVGTPSPIMELSTWVASVFASVTRQILGGMIPILLTFVLPGARTLMHASCLPLTRSWSRLERQMELTTVWLKIVHSEVFQYPISGSENYQNEFPPKK